MLIEEYALVKALERFIVPLIQGDVPGAGECPCYASAATCTVNQTPSPNACATPGTDISSDRDESSTEKESQALDYSRSGFNPTTEARDLLDAFKKYVVSLVKPRSEQGDTESAGNSNAEKGAPTIVHITMDK